MGLPMFRPRHSKRIFYILIFALAIICISALSHIRDGQIAGDKASDKIRWQLIAERPMTDGVILLFVLEKVPYPVTILFVHIRNFPRNLQFDFDQ